MSRPLPLSHSLSFSLSLSLPLLPRTLTLSLSRSRPPHLACSPSYLSLSLPSTPFPCSKLSERYTKLSRKMMRIFVDLIPSKRTSQFRDVMNCFPGSFQTNITWMLLQGWCRKHQNYILVSLCHLDIHLHLCVYILHTKYYTLCSNFLDAARQSIMTRESMILTSPRKYKISRVRFFMFVFTVSTTVLLSPLEIGISKKCTNDIYCHFTCSKG